MDNTGMDDEDYTHSDSVIIDAPPELVWAMVADVTRHGEWSPICTGGVWDTGHGPTVGSGFTGHNDDAGRTWETRCTVVAAEPGVEFAWQVNGDWVRWTFTTEAVDDRPGTTRLTEAWAFLPAGLAGFRAREGGQERVELRTQDARTGIPETLQAIKAIAETSN